MIAPNSLFPARSRPGKFLVAFSLAGDEKDLVRPIAEAVEQRLGWGTVFFYPWFEADLAGGASDLKLKDIFTEDSETVVVCASQAYADKPWTTFEWDAIRSRSLKLRADPDSAAADRILPLQVADGTLEGLLDITFWIDARQRSAQYVAGVIEQRLEKIVPDASKPSVFLAETTPDLEDASRFVNRQRLKQHLQDPCGCLVLPKNPLIDQPPDRYRHSLATDLSNSVAFVQLLSKYPWKGGGFDHTQMSMAEERGVPMYRYRGEPGEIDLNQVDAAFLEAHDPIVGNFGDFQHHLHDELPRLLGERAKQIQRWQEQEHAARTGIDAESTAVVSPLVRVAIRTGDENEKRVWRETFRVIHEKLGQENGSGAFLVIWAKMSSAIVSADVGSRTRERDALDRAGQRSDRRASAGKAPATDSTSEPVQRLLKLEATLRSHGPHASSPD